MDRGMSWREARRQELEMLVDEIEAADQAIARAQARRITAIEATRAVAVGAVPALDPAHGPVSPDDAARVSDVRSQQMYAHRAVVVEISCALRTPEATTKALVHDAQALVGHHPATMAALADGEISYVHAGVVLESTAALDPDDCRVLEARLVKRAKVSTVAGLRRFSRRERERTHPRPLIDRHRERLEERRVEIEPARDGMMWLHQYLPAAQATAIYNRLTDTAVTFQRAGEDRTLAQLRVDVLSALLLDDDAALADSQATACTSTTSAEGAEGAEGSVAPSATRAAPLRAMEAAGLGASTRPSEPGRRASGPSLRGVRPTVAVTVPVMTLLGRSEEPGHLEGYGPVDAETARELAARAPSFTRILTHPETSVVLSVGRTRYAVPSDLKTWLRLRDETCRFPGCSRRAARCDIDHVRPWHSGGPTDHDNLIHLCRHHHRLKHKTGWSVVNGVDHGREVAGVTVQPQAFARPEVVTWTSPAGRTYVDHPALPRPARLQSSSTERSTHQAAETQPEKGGQRPPTIPAAPSFPEDPPF